MKRKKIKIILICLLIILISFSTIGAFLIGKMSNQYMENNLKINTASTEEIKKKYDALYNLQYSKKDVTIISRDALQLSGMQIIANASTHKWVIAVHGLNSDRMSVFPQISWFLENGYNVLAIDQRAHGLSEGDYTTMGAWEKEDIRLWINSIVEQDAQSQIVLFGQSMGAASIMMSLGTKNFPQNVVALVEDCGYTSVYDIFQYKSKNAYGSMSKVIFLLTSMYLQLELQCNLTDASAIDAIKQANIPILFIHGDKDTTVPVSMARELFDTANGDKDILIVEGADHVQAANVASDEYYGKIQEFLEKYISN